MLFQRKSPSTCLDSAGTFLFLIFTSAFSSEQSLTSVTSLMNSFHVCASSPAHGNGNAVKNEWGCWGLSFTSTPLACWRPPAVRTLTRCCSRIIGYLRKIHKAIWCGAPCPALGLRGAAPGGEKQDAPMGARNLVLINNKLFITGHDEDFCSRQGHNSCTGGNDC